MTSDEKPRQRRFCEAMLVEVASLVELDPSQAPAGIEDFIARVGSDLGVDRIALCEVPPAVARSDPGFATTHVWQSPTVGRMEPVEPAIVGAAPWWIDRLRDGEPIELSPDGDLPEESGASPRSLEKLAIAWALVLPMISGARLVGLLVLQASSPPESIDPTRLRGLRAATRVIGTVLHRLQADRRVSLLEEINEAVDDFVVATDADGRIVYANRAVHRRFGYTPAELSGRPASIFMSPDNDEETWESIRAAHRDLLEGRRTSWAGHARNRTRDGEELWVSSRVTAINRQGRVDGLVVVSRDITRRKGVEQRLSILERVVDKMDHFVVVTDTSGRITYVNPAVERRFGYRLDELVGQLGRVLLAAGNPPDLADEIRTGTAAGGWSGDVRNVTRDGEEFWVSLDTTLVHDDGQPVAMVSLSRDITDRKRMELELERAVQKAEDASRAKGEFVANMSHEIRTPLNAIIGIIHLLQRTSLDARQRGLTHNLDHASVSLLDIVNDILDFSKIEAGRLELEHVAFSLGELLDELASLVQTRARSKDIEVVFRTDPDVPLALVGDPLRLRQVLVNLCDNAIKFTDAGEVVVRTSIDRRTDGEVVLRFSIRDTGIGISEEQQEGLFRPFSQADGSTSRRFGGSGLGLSICRRLVEMMGGEITVSSEPARGSEFVFTARFGFEAATTRRRVAPDLRGLRVLVVDDNATARLTMEEMLTQFGFSVTVASSAAEAIATLEAAPPERPFELVLMDWRMPGMDGIEATRRIKSHARIALVPTIIMVTAYGRDEVLRAGDEELLDGFLVKPIRPSTLFDAIAGVLRPHSGGGVMQPSQPPHAVRTEWEALRGARILLVEDNPVNQLVAREILEEEGVEVEVADNGAEALRAVHAREFDAILMDIQMPVMDGIETTGRILAGARHRTLPIIALTASAMTEDRERFLAAGMVDFVPKPIEPDHLFEVLLRWIGKERRAAAPSRRTSSATAGDDPPPILDVAGGLARVRGRDGLYRRILASFLDSSRNLVAELNRAFDAGSTRDALRLAHSLKGSAATVGAERARHAAAALETRLEATEPEESAAAFHKVVDEVEQARVAIEAILDKPGS